MADDTATMTIILAMVTGIRILAVGRRGGIKSTTESGASTIESTVDTTIAMDGMITMATIGEDDITAISNAATIVITIIVITTKDTIAAVTGTLTGIAIVRGIGIGIADAIVTNGKCINTADQRSAVSHCAGGCSNLLRLCLAISPP